LRGKKILLVDDDPRIRSLVAATLGKEYTLLHAATGEEALEIIREQKPDLVLLDIMMPGMDGYDVCLQIKSSPETRRIAVVMLTGKTEREEILKGFEVGADDYFTKPFSPRALLEKISEILDRS